MERLALKPAEVGDSLGCGRSKVYELIKRKEIPCVRIGGSVRVPVDALREWLAQQAK
jgi:excisionase family DNA binding protein